MPNASLSDRLREYAALTAEERAQVDAEAEARPDLADAWNEARALAALLDAAQQTDDLTTRIVDEHLGHGAPVSDPEAASLRAEMGRLAAAAEAPAAQYERLTGHALAPTVLPHLGDGRADGKPIRLAAERPAERGAIRLVRRLALAMVAVLGLYGMAFATSSFTTPERARVADVGDVSASFSATRGDRSNAFAAAVETLDEAKRSTLGLFPSYDEEGLERAAEAFSSVASADPDDLYGIEAALALGRIRVLQGRDEEARTALDAVMAQSRTRAPDAARLLDYLDEQAR